MDADMKRQLKEIKKRLDTIPEAIGVTAKGNQVTKERRVRSALRASAKKFIPALQAATPMGTKEHTRIRKKDGKEVTYYPGNLRKSQQVIRFTKASPLSIFVGPKLHKNHTEYGITKFDPYYAPMVHDGTRYFAGRPFMKKALSQAKVSVMQDLQKRIENIFRFHAKQKKLGKI